MHRANARAGEHGIGGFGDHRQIDRNAVALLDAVLLEHIRHAANVFIKLAIGDLLVDIGVVAFPDDGDLVATALQVTVDTVVGDVGDAVLIPLDGYVAVEIGVLDLGERFEPVDAATVLGPEAIRIAHAFLVPFEVGLIVNERVLLCLRQYGVKLFRHHFLQVSPTSSRQCVVRNHCWVLSSFLSGEGKLDDWCVSRPQ